MTKAETRRLRTHFLGWQCRVRQISCRQFGGQPMPAMRPCVSTDSRKVIIPEMTLLLILEEPSASTAFFKFQVQKTNDQEEVREAALRYMGADYFQIPEMFSDEMTAIFAANSPIAQSLSQMKIAVLKFDQYSQKYDLPCMVRRLKPREPAYKASYWQAQVFNSNLPGTVEVLAFKPNWKTAVADPSP
jgi:hypothetical protein